MDVSRRVASHSGLYCCSTMHHKRGIRLMLGITTNGERGQKQKSNRHVKSVCVNLYIS